MLKELQTQLDKEYGEMKHTLIIGGEIEGETVIDMTAIEKRDMAYLHHRDLAIIEAVREEISKGISNLCTSFPVRESDDFDEGRLSMQREALDIIKNI